MMALTATATERVRQDIVNLLKLREPSCYVASFNRPNLMYRVLAKNKPYEQVLEFLRARPKESGIVYCQARKTAESVSERFSEDGVKAKPFHRREARPQRKTNRPRPVAANGPLRRMLGLPAPGIAGLLRRTVFRRNLRRV